MKSSRSLGITAIFASCAFVVAATVVAAHAVSPPQKRSAIVFAVLESLEGDHRQVSFRPTKISINRSTKWQQTEPTQTRLAYSAMEPGLLQMEFTVTSASDVYADFIRIFKDLTQEDNALKRPPKCRFMWGTSFPVFEGVIETLNVKYVRFAADGTPLSAVVKIQMKEAHALMNRSEAEKLKK